MSYDLNNQTIKTIIGRRSCKKFKPDMIPAEALDKILEAGTYAATGRNLQSPIIIAITDKEKRDALSKLNAKILGCGEEIDPFYGAPVVCVVLADRAVTTYKDDGVLVLANLMLAAESFGFGNCYIYRAKDEFETEQGKSLLKELGIEGDYEGIGHCIIGYSDESPRIAKPRKENYVYRA